VTHKDKRTGTVTTTPATCAENEFPVRFDGSDGPDWVMVWDLWSLKPAESPEARAVYDEMTAAAIRL
jgi:hypothetical protein